MLNVPELNRLLTQISGEAAVEVSEKQNRFHIRTWNMKTLLQSGKLESP